MGRLWAVLGFLVLAGMVGCSDPPPPTSNTTPSGEKILKGGRRLEMPPPIEKVK